MQETVLQKLEFDKILEMLSSHAQSDMGKEAASLLRPRSHYDDVVKLQQMSAEAQGVYARLGRNPVDAYPDVRVTLKKIRAVAFLGMGELLELGRVCKASRLCKEALLQEDAGSNIVAMASQLPAIRSVEEMIFRCILSPEEMADAASSQLHSIRRQIKSAHEKVREKLNQMIHSSSYKTYLQEGIVTMRNGRYVLPVKAEHKGSVPGLVHDQSGSGATLFVEPMSVVEIGNNIRKLQSEEDEEIQRILADLTQQLTPYAQEIENALFLLSQIDLLFAKVALARRMKATEPRLNKDGYIRIMRGRHPLIDDRMVVPVDVWLGKDFKTLIITGPNTGGKTVTLKTVGLFCAMTQAGLFVPADIGTEMSVFEEIFADIGDEQSIEQSLSTFSSHMKNIVGILDKAESSSLVLMDELGSGTDPVEGAALAMAILQELHARGCITLATTHYSELKAFALTRDGMENASMEFDLQTLRPTYRLFVGIPGKSNAFAISQKLGLSEKVILAAEKFLDHEDVRFEDVISSAESQRKIAEEERAAAQAAREELDTLRLQVQREREKLEAQRERILSKARCEAQQTLKKAKEDSERVIRELKELQKEENESQRSRTIQSSRDALREMERAQQIGEIKSERDLGEALTMVEPGEEVYVVSLDQNALVLDKVKNGEVSIQAGILKMNVKLSDLRRKQGQKPKKDRKDKKPVNLSMAPVSREIDVRGENVEEAMWEIDRFIDEAARSGVNEVSIIHGKGTGVLRNGVHMYLKQNPHVKSFRLGKYGEGEGGVSIVTLR